MYVQMLPNFFRRQNKQKCLPGCKKLASNVVKTRYGDLNEWMINQLPRENVAVTMVDMRKMLSVEKVHLSQSSPKRPH